MKTKCHPSKTWPPPISDRQCKEMINQQSAQEPQSTSGEAEEIHSSGLQRGWYLQLSMDEVEYTLDRSCRILCFTAFKLERFADKQMDPTAAPRDDRRWINTTQAAEAQSLHHKLERCRVDPDHLLGIVGIVGTVLNLLVVVLVYIYTPV
ncbi:hypothetical protein AMECASPLE_002641 [Ameca splendens]|uniref:Uncharacterized protein n=1 Tax=Ameca splendens TaxID=208324 RepID=A0ABV0ZJ04_9TELE